MLELGDKRILIDCGMEQGMGGGAHNKIPFAYDPSTADYLFVTHAHIDHVGLIGKLVKHGFAGEIYSTQETKEIGALLMADAVKIQHDPHANPEDSLYSLEDVSKALSLWRTLSYHEKKDFGAFSIELFNAGHVLGSSYVKVSTEEGSMLFTGDIGNSPSLLLADREEVPGVDYILMESVYGDRNHEGRESRVARFAQMVSESIARGGTLLIPAFSLERTQEILMLLDNMFEEKKLPSAPVFLDSPLAERITPIFERALGADKFNFKELVKIARIAESHEIWEHEGAKIIIAGSGMSTAGRILGHEEHYLPDENNTLLFMGYQAVGTLGRQIQSGVKKIMIKGREGESHEVIIRAKIENIEGFSGHADSDALVDFVSKSGLKAKKIFIAMGEPKSQIYLAQRIRDELGLEAIATQEGQSFELDL